MVWYPKTASKIIMENRRANPRLNLTVTVNRVDGLGSSLL